MIFAWQECGRLRFGCQRPAKPLADDPFLLWDQSVIARSTSDPAYRPLQEFFEPWAQQWASSEQYAGFGMVSQADDLTEPWMEGKFGTIDLPDEQGVSIHQQGNLDHRQAQSHSSSTLSVADNIEPDDFPEPWAFNHVIKMTMSLERTIRDQVNHLPEWYGVSNTINSTSAGSVYGLFQQGPHEGTYASTVAQRSRTSRL